MRLLFLSKYREAGLLLLRASLGVLFVYLGGTVLAGGAAKWTHYAVAIRAIGIHSHLQWWGLVGALAQFIGGVLLIFGLFFRLGILLVLATVVVHAISLWKPGSLAAFAPIEFGVILFCLLFIGPGKLSVDKS